MSQNPIQAKFSKYYQDNTWGGIDGSGMGSLPESTRKYQKFLEEYIIKNNVGSVLDYGCGGWAFTKDMMYWKNVRYYGVDVVQSVIENNIRLYGSETVTFEVIRGNAEDVLPRVDLIIVKDVFQHLPASLSNKILTHLESFAGRILITNDYPLNNESIRNREIIIGGWTTVDLKREPYNRDCEVIFQWTSPHKIDPSVVFEIKIMNNF